MARRKSTDSDPGPEGGWIAPGPGKAQTTEEFLAGTHDQTPDEYEAEIKANGGRTTAWAKVFAKDMAKLREKGR